MRTCTKCKQGKSPSDFGRDVRRSDGLKSSCKECERLASREYAKSEKGRKTKSDYHKQYSQREGYREYNLEQCRKYNQSERGKIIRKEYGERYYEANRDVFVAKNKARETAILKAFPSWANKSEIATFYKRARELTESTGVKHHVDHIVPLRSKLVCGLHVESNLRVITASENVSKGNRLIESS